MLAAGAHPGELGGCETALTHAASAMAKTPLALVAAAPAPDASSSQPEQLTGWRLLVAHTVFPVFVTLVTVLYVTLSGRLTGLGGTMIWIGFFLGSLAFILCLERLLPYRAEWNGFGRQEINDFGHLLLQVTPGSLLGSGVVYGLMPWVLRIMPAHESWSLWPVQAPFVVQLLLAWVLQEACGYTFHRLSHHVPFLWRFHRLHHTCERLTATRTFRQHLIETAIDLGLFYAVGLVLGIPRECLLWLTAYGFAVTFIGHSNVDVRVPTWLNLLVVTPPMHRIHHELDLRAGNSNFAIQISLFDHLFGTYIESNGRQSGPLGVPGNTLPVGFWGQVLSPWLWKRLDRDSCKLEGGR